LPRSEQRFFSGQGVYLVDYHFFTFVLVQVVLIAAAKGGDCSVYAAIKPVYGAAGRPDQRRAPGRERRTAGINTMVGRPLLLSRLI
jgi:hypothetical protein